MTDVWASGQTGREVTSFPIIFPVDFEPFTKGTGSTRQSPR